MTNKTEKVDVLTKIILNKDIAAPIKKGDKLGKVYIIIDGNIVGQIDIVSNDNVKERTIYDNIYKISENYFI